MGNFFAGAEAAPFPSRAAAYAVVAWVLLQVFDNAAPILVHLRKALREATV